MNYESYTVASTVRLEILYMINHINNYRLCHSNLLEQYCDIILLHHYTIDIALLLFTITITATNIIPVNLNNMNIVELVIK